MDMYQKICTAADSIQQELSALRRDFHQYAEAGWFEMRTSSIIARKLTELGRLDVLKCPVQLRDYSTDEKVSK